MNGTGSNFMTEESKGQTPGMSKEIRDILEDLQNN